MTWDGPGFLPEALREAEEARCWYESRRAGLGSAFVDAVERALLIVIAAPMAGAPMGGEIRRVLIRGFPYWLLYASVDGRLMVLAIAHMRRQPGYWLDRHRGSV